jgi:hypothetical protein
VFWQQSQCDRQEIAISLKTEIQDRFRRRFGLHLESLWVPISPYGPISSEKVDPETSVEFHMILYDFQARPLAEDIHLVEGKFMIQGRYNNQQYGDRML